MFCRPIYRQIKYFLHIVTIPVACYRVKKKFGMGYAGFFIWYRRTKDKMS